MPYVIRKVRNKNCYSVKNIESGKIHAKCATKEKAKKQIRLLNAIEHGWKPSKSPKKMKNKAKDGYIKTEIPEEWSEIPEEWLYIFTKNDLYEDKLERDILKKLKKIEELKKEIDEIEKIRADMRTPSIRIY
jgi:hypothetical protein